MHGGSATLNTLVLAPEDPKGMRRERHTRKGFWHLLQSQFLATYCLSENKEDLLALAKDTRYENPKLDKLQQVLQNQFRADSGSRGIVFVRTRQGAHSLFQWVQDNVDLQQQGIKAAVLTGAGYSTQTKHMTQVRPRIVFLLG